MNGIPFFTTQIDIAEVLRSPVKKFFARMISPMRCWLTHPRMTIFGLPFEPYVQTPILDALPSTTSMLEIAEQNGADIIGLINLVPGHEQSRMLASFGFASLPSFPSMIVHLTSRSFDDHLSQLTAKERHDVRRNMRTFHHARHCLREVTSCGYSREMHHAYYACRRHAKIKWLAYTPDYFSEWQNAGPCAKLIVAESCHDEFLGFINFIFHDDTMHVARLVVSPAWHKRDSIFFRLLYSAIEEGCKRGAKRIMLGPTAYRVKRRIGAEPQVVNNYFLPVTCAWRIALPRLMVMMKRELRYLDSMRMLERYY